MAVQPTDDQHDALNPAPSDPDFLGPMFPIYDGNGNVVKMIRFESLGGSPEVFEAREAASYEYGPFGENKSTAGELGAPGMGGTHQGQRNPFRFSTKYTDAETGLVYYGYRYYSPSMGRWISRDPSAEESGPSLYSFVSNGPSIFIDAWGLWKRNSDWTMTRPGSYQGTAMSECGDKLEDLAFYITGQRSDAGLVSLDAFSGDDVLQGGVNVDISGLLQVLERRLRAGTVSYTGSFKALFGGGVRTLNETAIRGFFTGNGTTADCGGAAWLIQSRALLDQLQHGEFAVLFGKVGSVPFYMRAESDISKAVLGDMFAMPNDPAYYGLLANVNSPIARKWRENRENNNDPTKRPPLIPNDWLAEYVIKTGNDNYFAHGVGRGKTHKQIRQHMLNFNNGLRAQLGRPAAGISSIPTTIRDLQFLDVVEIAKKTFDHRRSER